MPFEAKFFGEKQLPALAAGAMVPGLAADGGATFRPGRESRQAEQAGWAKQARQIRRASQARMARMARIARQAW